MVVASEGAAEALIKAGEESDRLLSPSMAACRGAPNHTVREERDRERDGEWILFGFSFLPLPMELYLSDPPGPRRLV